MSPSHRTASNWSLAPNGRGVGRTLLWANNQFQDLTDISLPFICDFCKQLEFHTHIKQTILTVYFEEFVLGQTIFSKEINKHFFLFRGFP